MGELRRRGLLEETYRNALRLINRGFLIGGIYKDFIKVYNLFSRLVKWETGLESLRLHKFINQELGEFEKARKGEGIYSVNYADGLEEESKRDIYIGRCRKCGSKYINVLYREAGEIIERTPDGKVKNTDRECLRVSCSRCGYRGIEEVLERD